MNIVKKLFIYLIAITLIFSSCNKEVDSPGANSGFTYGLGQEHAGGIIIELDTTNEHGLVVAKVDQVAYVEKLNWSNSQAQVEAYENGGSGWRLPTRTELELIYNNRSAFSLTGFENRNYWSSTLGTNTAWSKYFGAPGGITTSNWKQLSNCTLCSRGVKEF